MVHGAMAEDGVVLPGQLVVPYGLRQNKESRSVVTGQHLQYYSNFHMDLHRIYKFHGLMNPT